MSAAARPSGKTPGVSGGSLRAAGEVFAEQRDRGQRPAGEDQVDADQQADRPVGGAGELGEDEDPDHQAADAAEADQAGVRLTAAEEGDGDPSQAHEEEVD